MYFVERLSRLLPFSGKSGFFRLALLFGKPFLFGTLLGFQSFGFRLASCFRIRRGSSLYRYRQAHGDKITLSRMVAGNEILLFISARIISSDFTRLARIFAVARFSASLPSELQ